MAEIKSTIDLIMERTRNLSASPEERESFHRQEREKQFRAMIQRLLDNAVSLDELKKALEKEKGAGHGAEAVSLMKPLFAERIDPEAPEAETERLFRDIKALLGTPEAALRKTLDLCRTELAALKDDLLESQRRSLLGQGISGPAVLPNPERDPSFKTRIGDFRSACAGRFLAAINS